MTALNKQALLSTDKHANQHMLSRLIVEDNSAELRDVAEAVEQYTDRLIAALEAAEKRIAELEARTVTLPDERFRYGESDYDDGYANGWNAHGIETKSALRAAGIGVKGV
ncbi:hypothetical protein OIPHN330_22910 [Citrobacter freundii]|uniref:hypothetical protein n=1 Tax=Citrobacter freundii TaxID=546 RepID=UPI002B31B4E8|nr:hypothetical protein OIPHN330_22910 [Citrobacter freundii]BEJ39570.1 hypothetical protein OIPHN354_22820 [Citrobacter freundii]